MDEMLRDFGDVGFARNLPSFASDDVEETDDAYVIRCDVPGVAAEDIDLSVEGDSVSVRAERNDARNSTIIEHTYTLRGIDASRADARCDNGVLTVTLPKRDAAKRRTIPVRLPKRTPEGEEQQQQQQQQQQEG